MSTRLNKAELEALDNRRDGKRRGAYLRACFLGNAPAPVPEINKKVWRELARAAANLNQIAIKLNLHDDVELRDVQAALRNFRINLISHSS